MSALWRATETEAFLCVRIQLSGFQTTLSLETSPHPHLHLHLFLKQHTWGKALHPSLTSLKPLTFNFPLLTWPFLFITITCGCDEKEEVAVYGHSYLEEKESVFFFFISVSSHMAD